jgi:hypothetical protein
MRVFKVAHINQGGNDVIILPLDETFGAKPVGERQAILQELNQAAREQGLKGTVVPVWPNEKRLRFLAPKPWHPFFGSISWDWLMGNLNRELAV